MSWTWQPPKTSIPFALPLIGAGSSGIVRGMPSEKPYGPFVLVMPVAQSPTSTRARSSAPTGQCGPPDQPMSCIRNGVRSRVLAPFRSAFRNGSTSLLGVRVVSQWEVDDPGANAAGAYSFGKPSASAPANPTASSATRGAVTPGRVALLKSPSLLLI